MSEKDSPRRPGGGPAADPAPSSTARTGRRMVLVVEDDPDTQAFMATLLRRHYDVVTAASEQEFWSEIEKRGESICVILMDLSLRGSEDGLAITRQFRSDPRWNAIPVVALTAHALTEDRDRALEAGCAVYLSKPIERRRLIELIESLTRN